MIEYPKYNCEAPEILNDGICSRLYNQSKKWNRSCAFRKCGVLSGLWEEALFLWHLLAKSKDARENEMLCAKSPFLQKL